MGVLRRRHSWGTVVNLDMTRPSALRRRDEGFAALIARRQMSNLPIVDGDYDFPGWLDTALAFFEQRAMSPLSVDVGANAILKHHLQSYAILNGTRLSAKQGVRRRHHDPG